MTQLQISELSAGMYILQLRSEDNTIFKNLKVIKE